MPKTTKKTARPAVKKTAKSKAAAKKTIKKKTVAVKTKASVKKAAIKKTVAVKKSKKNYDEIKSLKIWLFFVGFLLLLGLVLSNLYWSQDRCQETCSFMPNILKKKVIDEPVLNESESLGLANPASMNCLDMDGNLEMKKRGDGGEYGVCIFPSGNECEEWSLYQGACPAEGVDISSYNNLLDYYCVVTGGEIDGDSCFFEGGQSCDLEDYYNGICHK